MKGLPKDKVSMYVCVFVCLKGYSLSFKLYAIQELESLEICGIGERWKYDYMPMFIYRFVDQACNFDGENPIISKYAKDPWKPYCED